MSKFVNDDGTVTSNAASGFDPLRDIELGNLMFGNSRGEYAVDRDLQDEWCRSFGAMGFDSYGSNDGPEWAFENAVFRVQPYYWGDCTCGYEEREAQWSQRHSHADDCYQVHYRAIREEHGYGWDEGPNAPANKLVRELCKKHRLSYPAGSAVHCTCTYDHAWHEWSAANGHAEDCALVQPNFLHKPSGFRLDWYKYPLRDSYSSQRLTRELMRAMFADCMASLRDSDENPEGGDGTAPLRSDDSAGRNGIVSTEPSA